VKTIISLIITCLLLIAFVSSVASSDSGTASPPTYNIPPAVQYIVPTVLPSAAPSNTPSIDNGTDLEDVENIEDAEEMLDDLEEAQ